jgi:hypothetical protein
VCVGSPQFPSPAPRSRSPHLRSQRSRQWATPLLKGTISILPIVPQILPATVIVHSMYCLCEAQPRREGARSGR